MWQIITGYLPIQPPEAAAMLLDPVGTGAINIWTYGGLLMDNDQYGKHDYSLRETIAWCMGKCHPTRTLPTDWLTLSGADVAHTSILQL